MNFRVSESASVQMCDCEKVRKCECVHVRMCACRAEKLHIGGTRIRARFKRNTTASSNHYTTPPKNEYGVHTILFECMNVKICDCANILVCDNANVRMCKCANVRMCS